MKNCWLILLVMAASCTNSEQEGRARIMERRVLRDGRLMLTYLFNTGKELVTDSAEVANRPIPGDSVQVYYQASDPHKSRLALP